MIQTAAPQSAPSKTDGQNTARFVGGVSVHNRSACRRRNSIAANDGLLHFFDAGQSMRLVAAGAGLGLLGAITALAGWRGDA